MRIDLEGIDGFSISSLVLTLMFASKPSEFAATAAIRLKIPGVRPDEDVPQIGVGNW